MKKLILLLTSVLVAVEINVVVNCYDDMQSIDFTTSYSSEQKADNQQ